MTGDPTEVNGPPAIKNPPAAVSASTGRSGLGFQKVFKGAPAAVPNFARPRRAVPLIVVNDPPTNTLPPVATIAAIWPPVAVTLQPVAKPGPCVETAAAPAAVPPPMRVKPPPT